MTNVIYIDGVKANVQKEPWASIVAQIYADRKAGKPTPELTCTADHRGRMYLQPRTHKHAGRRLWAVHYAGEGGEGCSVAIGSNQGPGHLNYKAYAATGLERHGFTVQEECTIKVAGDRTRRLDLAVTGAPIQLGLEVQMTGITSSSARGRTTEHHGAGWTTIWAPGSTQVAQRLGAAVPMLRPHTEINWAAGVPNPNTVAVLSKRRFVMEPCTVLGRFTTCPDTGRGMCGKHHPMFVAPDEGFDVLDEVLGELASGLTVPLMDAKGRNWLVSAEEYLRYEEATGLSGEYRAASARAEKLWVPTEAEDIACTADRLAPPEPEVDWSRFIITPEREAQYEAEREARERASIAAWDQQAPRINATVRVVLVDQYQVAVKLPDFHEQLDDMVTILKEVARSRQWHPGFYYWTMPVGFVTRLTERLRDRGATVEAAYRPADQIPEQQALAYKAGLCTDCRVIAHSAGRPRCNDCHTARRWVAS